MADGPTLRPKSTDCPAPKWKWKNAHNVASVYGIITFYLQRLLVHWSLMGSETRSCPLHSLLYQT